MRFSSLSAALGSGDRGTHRDLTNRRLQALFLGIALGGGAAILAFLVVIGGPLIAFGAIFGIGVGLYVLTSLNAGLLLTLAVVALLPFGTLPIRVAITPTFLDLAVGSFLLVYLFQWMTGRRTRFRMVPASVLIIGIVGWILFSFILGLSNAMPTTAILRKFVEMVLSILLSLILIDVMRDPATLRRAALALLIAGAAQAMIGIGLSRLPDTSAERLLNLLSRFGYPAGNVLRYVEDNPELGGRAIGTWVDPNAYGGFLLMVGTLAGTQVLSAQPLLKRRWLIISMFGLITLAILLTQSRGAWLALAAAMAFVALLRYRWLLVAGVVTLSLLLTLPFMQDYANRLVEGLSGRDLATQMRFGEYKDALTLIGRYPLTGVGFTGTPDRDIYLGVSSTYLKIAGATGLIGLSLFTLLMIEVFRYGLKRWKRLNQRPDLVDLWLGFSAGLIGALVSGVVDHYYFNLEFQGAIFMLWLYVGMSLSAARLVDETEQIAA